MSIQKKKSDNNAGLLHSEIYLNSFLQYQLFRIYCTNLFQMLYMDVEAATAATG